MGPQSWDALAHVLAGTGARARFAALTHTDPSSTCLWWTGAVSGRGHGRFWLAGRRTIIAHRFAYAAAYGTGALRAAPVLAHSCDNPLCQNPAHLDAVPPGVNSRQWATRRHRFYGPLADPRGSRRRARAIRDGLRTGQPLLQLLHEGRTELERGQLPLW